MIAELITIIIAVGILALLYYLLKNVTTLIVNSVIGLVVLFLAKYANILGMCTKAITWMDVLICALAGLPGSILLIILHAIGLV